MNKQVALVLVGLSLCLGGTAIVKPSIFGFNSSKESLDYEFLETKHFRIKYSKSLEKLGHINT